MALTGDVGTGKTTLLNALAKSFDDNFIFARIPDPSLEVLDFLNFTASELEMNQWFLGKRDFLSELGSVSAALSAYVQAVRSGEFPAPEHCFT